MHELSIAESILDAVRKELLGHPGARPVRVGLRVGVLAAIDVDSLSFCFEAILAGTEWESLTLDAKICPAKRSCLDCSNEFIVIDYNAVCPVCGGESTLAVGGDELDFDYLEIDSDETQDGAMKSEEVKINGANCA